MAPSSSSQTNGHENLNLQRPYQSIASLSRVDKNRPSAVVVDSSVPTAQRKERQHPHQAQEQRQERQQMRSDGGKPTKKGIHLTSFAKSAARRMRFGWSCQDAENYGHLVDDRVSFQPLAGASVVIVANSSSYDKVFDVEYERDSLGCAVESMGGRWVPALKDNDTTITHAIWIDVDSPTQSQITGLSNETLVELNTCLALDIPVVGTEWLVKIRELKPGQHWTEVDVGSLIPTAIKMFNEVYNGKRESPRINSRRKASSSNRRDTATSLNASITETYHTLLDQNPDALEKDAIRRAMELSMLDFAVVQRSRDEKSRAHVAPHDILMIDHDASMKEIKNAYRRRALETHPDKGGKPGAFEAVARAYRLLLNAANGHAGSFEKNDVVIGLKTTAHWDSELKEHSSIVRELFERHGNVLSHNMRRQDVALSRLGLCHKDAGSQNYNEIGERIHNSCFYLSLAASYLSGIEALAVWNTPDVNDDTDMVLLRKADNALIRGTALQLKRAIETAVLSAHPEWAVKGLVGEEVQAFADFLVYAFESTFISDWAVVIFDSSSGFVDVYKGKHYKDESNDSDLTRAASNTLTLRYVPGHYTPLVAASPDSIRPSLENILSSLDQCGVLFVVTDGAAE